MAESSNANSTTSESSSPNPILEGVSSFLKVTTWLAVGFVFLFIGVICKIKRPIPASWEPFFNHHIPHLPYFVCGLGFLCLAHARSLLRKEYAVEQKKDFLYPHAWKVSLLGTQVFLLYSAGIYAILFGLNLGVPPLGMFGLVAFIACFFMYLLWYQVEYFKNRLPAFAALRIAIMAFIFAGVSFCLWTLYQMIIPSLILAFMGVFSGIYSLSYSGPVSQKGAWFKYIFMIGTVAFLGAVGYYALDLWKPQTEPLDTVAVAKGLRGEIGNLVFSPKGDKLVFTQKFNNQWYLQIVSPDNKSPVTIKLPKVDGSFRSYFVDDGKSLLLDAPQNEKRELLKVDIDSGAMSALVKSDVEPFSGGSPLSSTNQFLFVTKSKKGYDLNEWTPGQTKTALLYTSPTLILAPSWTTPGEVVYVDGVHSTPYVLDIKKKTTNPIISEDDKKEQPELVENDPLVEVIPSPDNFRYLCVGRGKDGKTTLWTMLLDGTKRVEVYKTDDQLNDIAWLADAQKIVFERNGLQKGFKNNIKGIAIINANLRTFENMVPPQINCHSPAGSPDGIKIAFVGSEGLWYPSLDSGIWVVVLR